MSATKSLPTPTFSVSNHKSVEASGLRVLVSHEAIATLGNRPLLGVQKHAQVLVEAHLAAEILSVVLDVPLVLTQHLHNVLLLLQLHLEVLLEGLVVWEQSRLWLADVGGLSLDSSLECLKDVGLDIVLMVLGLGLLVLQKVLTHLLDNHFLLLLHLTNYRVVVLLLDQVDLFLLSHGLSQVPQLLDARRQVSLLLPDLFLDLLDESSQLL